MFALQAELRKCNVGNTFPCNSVFYLSYATLVIFLHYGDSLVSEMCLSFACLFFYISEGT